MIIIFQKFPDLLPHIHIIYNLARRILSWRNPWYLCFWVCFLQLALRGCMKFPHAYAAVFLYCSSMAGPVGWVHFLAAVDRVTASVAAQVSVVCGPQGTQLSYF